MVRTTLNLREEQIERLRALANKEKRTLTQQIDIVLENGLDQLEKERPTKEWRYDPPGTIGGFLPGVNPDDMASMRELMDAYDERHRH
jgi:hypothetical protein